MIIVVIEQHKSNLLKASYLGANQSKENIGFELKVAKMELGWLKKELAKEKKKAAHLEEKEM